MKLKLVPVVLSALLSFAIASPRANAQSGPNLGAKNMQALALIGSSFNDFVQAPAYRGHLVLTKVSFAMGQGTVAKTLDWKSSWQNAGDGEFSKRSSEAIFTENKAGATTTEKFSGVDDGTLTKRFYESRQVWSERPAIREYDIALNFARAPLQIAVLLAAQGSQFEIVNEKYNGEDAKVVRTGTALQVVLDPKTLALKSWKAEKTGETSSCVWLEQDLKPTFKPEEWAFKVPPTAKKVDPETVNLNLEF